MRLRSPAFENGEEIPKKYTCQGEDINPPLTIEEIPDIAKSLVLVIDDPDAPVGVWDHWIVWNIKPTSQIKENSVPGIVGTNSWGKTQYGGPCPPNGKHEYRFSLFAVNVELDLPSTTTKNQLLTAIKEFTLDKAELSGYYQKEP